MPREAISPDGASPIAARGVKADPLTRSARTATPRERFIIHIEHGNPDLLLVAVPAQGKRAVTKTLRRAEGEAPAEFLRRAVRWRDRAWRRVNGGAVPARSFHVNAREGSLTGVPGVRVVDKKVRKGDRVYVVRCVIAEVHVVAGQDYRRPSGSRSRLYSLNRYEFDEAVALATAWRAALGALLVRDPQP